MRQGYVFGNKQSIISILRYNYKKKYKSDKFFLDFARNFALIIVVNPLAISVQSRVASRVVFYVTTIFVFWIVGITQSSESEVETQKDAQLGVAKAYYGHPFDPRIVRASR